MSGLHINLQFNQMEKVKTAWSGSSNRISKMKNGQKCVFNASTHTHTHRTTSLITLRAFCSNVWFIYICYLICNTTKQSYSFWWFWIEQHEGENEMKIAQIKNRKSFSYKMNGYSTHIFSECECECECELKWNEMYWTAIVGREIWRDAAEWVRGVFYYIRARKYTRTYTHTHTMEYFFPRSLYPVLYTWSNNRSSSSNSRQ